MRSQDSNPSLPSPNQVSITLCCLSVLSSGSQTYPERLLVHGSGNGEEIKVGNPQCFISSPGGTRVLEQRNGWRVRAWHSAVSKDPLLLIPLGATCQGVVSCTGGMRGPMSPRADHGS